MDTYKLKDFAKGSGKLVAESGVLKVTELKAGVKNPERVNVYINDEYALSLFVTQVVEYKLKVGKIVTGAELVELRRASEYGKLYQRTLEWVLMRPRSVRETRDYLTRRLRKATSGFSDSHAELIDEIVERLTIRGYLDDEKFAQWWVENRFVKKGVSQKRLRMELAKNGVEKETMESVLGGRDDREEIQKIIAKKRAKYDDPEKLMAYLCRQGFSYELVREMLEQADDT